MTEEIPYDDRVDTLILNWSGGFKCGHCGIYIQFTASLVNRNDETNKQIREKTNMKNCMFCGKKHEGGPE